MKDEIKEWVEMWAEMMPVKKPSNQMKTGYFFGTPTKESWDRHQPDDLRDDWLLIDEKVKSSQELMNGKDEEVRTGSTKYFPPVPINTLGPDGIEDYDYPQHAPVTKNFTSGEKLNLLDDIKRKLEIIERKLHKAELSFDKKSKTKYLRELKKLRSDSNKLSDDIQPQPQKDMT